jgi:hypothetical protein
VLREDLLAFGQTDRDLAGLEVPDRVKSLSLQRLARAIAISRPSWGWQVIRRIACRRRWFKDLSVVLHPAVRAKSDYIQTRPTLRAAALQPIDAFIRQSDAMARRRGAMGTIRAPTPSCSGATTVTSMVRRPAEERHKIPGSLRRLLAAPP